jgi:hypothetical protein
MHTDIQAALDATRLRGVFSRGKVARQNKAEKQRSKVIHSKEHVSTHLPLPCARISGLATEKTVGIPLSEALFVLFLRKSVDDRLGRERERGESHAMQS